MDFEICSWFDKLISYDNVSGNFADKQVADFLNNNFEVTKNNSYVAFKNPFSERLQYYISRNNLEKYSPPINPLWNEYYDKAKTKKLVLNSSANTLIKLKNGFYFFSFYQESTLGSMSYGLVVFVKENGIEWTKQDVEKQIYEFSRELKDFQERERQERADDKAFDGIFLPGNMLEEIKSEVENFLNSRELYSNDMKLPFKRGLLFYGPPGNGKTSLIRAICKYYGLDYRDIKESIKNNGDVLLPSGEERGIDYVLFPAKYDVSVWIMEDLDKLVDFNGKADNTSASVSLHDVLKGLDGINQVDGALILATTNNADVLTESLANRPGRFDRIWEIGLPDENQIEKLLIYHKINVLDKDEGVKEVAEELADAKSSMAFAEEFVKSAKMKYRKNDILYAEASEIIGRIKDHNKSFEKKFKKKKKQEFGFTDGAN